MRFFHLMATSADPVNELFRAACESRSVEYVGVTPDSLPTVLDEPPRRGDLLYRSGMGPNHLQIEALLFDPRVATFYRTDDGPLTTFRGGKGAATLMFAKSGVPVPRTVYYVNSDRHRLARSVEYLGGFPVVLKAGGGQYGLGVLKVDGFEALYSVVDFMLYKGELGIVMQEFVPHRSILRTICIGDRVVAGRRISVLPNDFRSHTREAVAHDEIRARGVTEFPAEIVDLSVAATHALFVDFSGLDIIEAEDGRNLLSEANFPCIHVTTEQTSAVPVSQLMIDFLIAKSGSL